MTHGYEFFDFLFEDIDFYDDYGFLDSYDDYDMLYDDIDSGEYEIYSQEDEWF